MEDEKPEWNESFDEWVKRYWGKYPPIDSDELEVKWKKWKEQMKEEKEKEEEEKEEKEKKKEKKFLRTGPRANRR